MDDRPGWFDALSDRYRYVREIGRGGMACVHLVEDLRYHRHVALKVLRDELAHAVAHDRFLEEIRVAARLNHPNVVPLYDSGVVPAGDGHPALPWFTMMYIAGESLRERLARGPLPVPDAVDIARAVAAALDYAHGERVIHRDIKPGNILLAGEVPVVADFGIARALDRSGGVDTLTSPGLAIGTAHYISPEQAGGEPVDERSDVYSLGCVVYEMLAGHPPFTGPTPQAIIARHNLDPPPPLGTVRPSVPPATVAAVEKALAKKQPDRWPSAGAFAHALRETTEHAAVTARIPAWRRGWLALPRVRVAAFIGAAMFLAGVTWALWQLLGSRQPSRLSLDTYAILSTQGSDDSRVPMMLVGSAIERWGGSSVMLEVAGRGASTLHAEGGPRVDVRESLAKARRLRAGRLVIPELDREGDSRVLRLGLWDTETGKQLGLAEGSIAGPGGRVASGRVDSLVDGLIVGQFGPPRACALPRAPAALPAVRKLRLADSLIAEWALGAAEDTLGAAATLDPGLAPALLCRSLLLSWTESDDLVWGSQLVGLVGGTASFADRDQGILAALAARQNGDLGGACATWRALAERHPEDFLLQYGLADCLVADPGVLRDRRARSGWRFRAEYGEARAAFAKAVGLNPNVYRALVPGVASAARQLLSIKPSITRVGIAVRPDTGVFNARRTLEGDTLAYVPIPRFAFATARPASAAPPGSVAAADARIHELLYRFIANWRAIRPREVEALAVLAEALEVRGDRSAIDSLRRARALATEPVVGYRIAAAEVLLLVRLALPADTAVLRSAVNLADSLLGARPLTPEVAYDRAALAALRGRALEAAAGWRQPELTKRLQVPPYLNGIAPALQVFAAMGGPTDSIRELERKVEGAIRRSFANADQLDERMRWLALPATIAWPQFQFATSSALRGRGDPILDAVVAAEAHDMAAVRRSLRPYWDARARKGTQAVTLDGLRTEAELRWTAGEEDRAIEMLDDTLGSLFGLGPAGLQDPLQAAGLVRAAALRARYAAARGDRRLAREWAHVVSLLWSDAEPSAHAAVRGALDLVNPSVQ